MVALLFELAYSVLGKKGGRIRGEFRLVRKVGGELEILPLLAHRLQQLRFLVRRQGAGTGRLLLFEHIDGHPIGNGFFIGLELRIIRITQEFFDLLIDPVLVRLGLFQ